MEEPDTIDEVEFLRSSAIKWQNHARQTYMLIEILRDDPEYNCVFWSLTEAQKCHAMESQVARERLFKYMELEKR